MICTVAMIVKYLVVQEEVKLEYRYFSKWCGDGDHRDNALIIIQYIVYMQFVNLIELSKNHRFKNQENKKLNKCTS